MASSWVSWVAPCALAGAAVAAHIGNVRGLELREQANEALILQAHGLIAERFVEALPPDALGYEAIHGMVASLDPHSSFYDPEEADLFREGTTGQFGGLGIYIAINEGRLEVIAPLEGTPAARAGILPGDIIISIDGEPARFQSTSDAIAMLKGEPGSVVELEVQHPGQATTERVSVERAVITVESVRGVAFLEAQPDIGYLRLIAFQDASADEFIDAVAWLVEQGAKALIIDLRMNPGGLLSRAADIADEFLPRGQLIVGTRSRIEGDEQMVSERDPGFPELPVAVLIDDGSASASEILGGALRDNARAVLVGKRSYGKGSVQSVIDLIDNRSILKLTTAYYTTPSGRRIHRPEGASPEDEWGLLPDILVDPPREELVAIANWQSDLYVARLRREAGEDIPLPPSPKDSVLEAAASHLRRVLDGASPLIPPPAPGGDSAGAAAGPEGGEGGADARPGD